MLSNVTIDDKAPELIPVRMLNEFVYCPRLFYIEYVQGDFNESVDTLEGHLKHKRVDSEIGVMPLPDRQQIERFHARSVMLSGEKCGLIAKMDLIEGDGVKVTPVDYKKGSKPGLPEGAWLTDQIQICAQGIILRENGYECSSGVIYYVQTKSRVTVEFTEELVKQVFEFAEKARKTAVNPCVPLPLEDSSKCPRCALVGICLPDETNQLAGKGDVVRRIVPALDEALPLYVQEQGATVSKSGAELIIKNRDGIIAKTRLMDISQLSMFGNIQITTQAVHELCERNIPICYFSHGGWFYGVTHGMSHKNVELRRKQFAVAENPGKSIEIARAFISGKVRNCRTMLRRNDVSVPQKVLDELAKSVEQTNKATTSEELLGIEGNAARIYFMRFGNMLKKQAGVAEFNFTERNRRPPRDPINALLSYTYALMTKDFAITLLATGFDPHLGLYHAPRYGKPALALDLMEEFRPLIADSVVVTLINNEEIQAQDFITRAGATAVIPRARKRVIRAYEQRLETQITHPVFGYKINYRRAIEVQARLLARYLTGESREYPAFCTR